MEDSEYHRYPKSVKPGVANGNRKHEKYKNGARIRAVTNRADRHNLSRQQNKHQRTTSYIWRKILTFAMSIQDFKIFTQTVLGTRTLIIPNSLPTDGVQRLMLPVLSTDTLGGASRRSKGACRPNKGGIVSFSIV